MHSLQDRWYPTDSETSARIVHGNYMELFCPAETAWREKTVTDFVAAARGVLDAKLK